MQNILTALDTLKNDAEKSIQEALSTIPDPKKLKIALEALPQLIGMQSMDESNYLDHPLSDILDSFSDGEVVSKKLVITNLFGGTKATNIELANPKIHPALKSFVIFDALLDNAKGVLIMSINIRQMEIEKIKASQSTNLSPNNKIKSLDFSQSKFFIPENGFGAMDLTNAEIFEKGSTIGRKAVFDNF
jgi:hypothetical protein